MRIISHTFGKFPEIEHLNPQFIPGRTKQKITIDVYSSAEKFKAIYHKLNEEVHQLFPTILRHDCGKPANNVRRKGPFHPYQGVIDVIHVIEHIMIDMMCHITDLTICSGITCHWWEPNNRFDIFVESTDQKASRFAAYYATSLVKDMLKNNQIDEKFHVLLNDMKSTFSQPPAYAQAVNF